MSQPIQNLAINNLLLKGYGNEYNGFSRLFKSVEEANKAVEESRSSRETSSSVPPAGRKYVTDVSEAP